MGVVTLEYLRMFWRSKKCVYKVTFFDEHRPRASKVQSMKNYILDKNMGETWEKFWVNSMVERC